MREENANVCPQRRKDTHKWETHIGNNLNELSLRLSHLPLNMYENRLPW